MQRFLTRMIMTLAPGRRSISLCMATISTLAVLVSWALNIDAQAGGSGNLPVYTSPIDITGLRLQLRAVAPDRNTGKPVEITLPGGLLGPKMNYLLATPLSTEMDQYWGSSRQIPYDGGMITPREKACVGKDGIPQGVQDAVAKIGSKYSAYNVSCNLASKGTLLAKQAGSTLTLAYELRHNEVTFTLATPFTCHAGHGTPACSTDPQFKVQFVSQIVTVLHTPGLCNLTGENAKVYTQDVHIEGASPTGALAQLVDDLFLGHKFSGAERAIESTVRQFPLPLDSAFKELRSSDACTGRNAALHRALVPFGFDVEIQLPKAVILQLSHVGIAAPTIGGPLPGKAPHVPGDQTVSRPSISTSQPMASAGASVQISGQYFPANFNLATAIPVSVVHGGYGKNSMILGGVCFAGATELQWGPLIAWGPISKPARIERLPGDAQGACARSFDAKNLAPSTAYQFRARDCDAFTCSPWSELLRVTTSPAGTGQGTVLITMDGATSDNSCNDPLCRMALSRRAGNPTLSPAVSRGPRDPILGSTTLSPQGTFITTVTIPGNASPGTHTIRAVSGDANAQVALTVNASNSAGRGAFMTIVGVLKGESGCPNHPGNSTQTDASFMLFGTGFASGGVSIYLDNTTARPLGTATVRPDGSFCQQMAGVPSSQGGAHTLLGVQNGVVQAKIGVRFVPPAM